MRYNPDIHHRRSIRLSGYDYAREGAYFITICVHNRECLLGDVVDGTIVLSEVGRTVENIWMEIPKRFSFVIIDTYILMPNHIHAVIIIKDSDQHNRVGALLAAPKKRNGEQSENILCNTYGRDSTSNPTSESAGRDVEGAASSAPTVSRLTLGKVLRAFKSISAIQANRLLDRAEQSFWQRNYFEHIIRDDQEMEQVRAYICQNPMQWLIDTEHPDLAGRQRV